MRHFSHTFMTYRDYAFRNRCFRIAATWILAFVGVILLLAVSTNVLAADGRPVPVGGVVLAFVMGVVFLAMAVTGTRKNYGPAGVEPTKPWPRSEDEEPTHGAAVDLTLASASASHDADHLMETFHPLPAPTRAAPPMPRVKPPYTGEERRRGIRATDLSDAEQATAEPYRDGIPGYGEAHKDDLGVFFFTFDMKSKLADCRARGRLGWHDPNVISDEQLKLALRLAMRKGDVVDIANHCMMLHQRGITNVS